MDGQRKSSGLSPTASFFKPNQPAASGETDLHSNLSGRELAPGLSIGYFALTPEQIDRRIRGSKRTAAVTIIDATTTNPLLMPTIANPTQGQSVELIAPNFLSLRLKPDASGKNLSLFLKLREICEFIDAHYATLAEQRKAEQEAARAFDEDDDEMFMGPALLGKTGQEATQHVAQQARLDREVMIHGGRTDRTQGQPTFVAIAYLMRKHHLTAREAIARAQAYDKHLSGAELYLTAHQRIQLDVWHACDYELLERQGNTAITKEPYNAYMRGAWFTSRFAAPGSGAPVPASR
ncbi:hypothetical protein V8F20_001833 [Naviculisporaceae sp. PSN 640]